jgi:hypothetical protein
MSNCANSGGEPQTTTATFVHRRFTHKSLYRLPPSLHYI